MFLLPINHDSIQIKDITLSYNRIWEKIRSLLQSWCTACSKRPGCVVWKRTTNGRSRQVYHDNIKGKLVKIPIYGRKQCRIFWVKNVYVRMGS